VSAVLFKNVLGESSPVFVDDALSSDGVGNRLLEQRVQEVVGRQGGIGMGKVLRFRGWSCGANREGKISDGEVMGYDMSKFSNVSRPRVGLESSEELGIGAG
jgi:hypothetical protein